MRIGFIGPAPPFRGGISRFAVRLALELQSEGHQVRMFSFIRQYPALIFPGKSQTAQSSDGEGLEIENVLTPYDPRTWNRALSAIRDWQPDMVIVSYFLPFFAPAYTYLCKRLSNTKRVVLAHNIEFHERWMGANLMTKKLLRHCEKIMVLSQACHSDLKRIMPKEIANQGVLGFHPVYDSYPETQIGRQGYPDRDKTLLFFGLIKPYKGLDVLIKAMQQVHKRLPDLRLTVAGEVYGKAEVYAKLIRSLGLEDVVQTHFRYIPEDEVASFFRSASLCVLPYKSATQSGIIAMSYNFDLPVIVTDAGGLNEYVEEGETGLVVLANDPEALAAGIIRCYEENLCERMSKAVCGHKHRYSWKSLATLVLEP
ncbi:MAG: glycosyltransferase family 4 protein [Candidatus Cloacimonadaceae bacterium]|nr:glycosyltransferase family 4 protein [Candidatus Cloacimonadaceae bacterium]MDP3113641.1 glycosyltransferase family 4 protein [Candidatus Cloacimonadaceae bacterium]